MGVRSDERLTELVEWFLLDQAVELRFIPNKTGKGRLAPEFDFEYWHCGRRITERGLAFLVLMELSRQNHHYQLSKVIAAITELGWRHYMANQEYPDWIATEPTPVFRRPPGRPRTKPRPVRLPKRELKVDRPKEYPIADTKITPMVS